MRDSACSIVRQPRLAVRQENGFTTLDGTACDSELCTEEQFRERIKGASDSALRMGVHLGSSLAIGFIANLISSQPVPGHSPLSRYKIQSPVTQSHWTSAPESAAEAANHTCLGPKCLMALRSCKGMQAHAPCTQCGPNYPDCFSSHC